MDAEFQQALRDRDYLKIARIHYRLGEVPLAYKYARQAFYLANGHMKCLGNLRDCPGQPHLSYPPIPAALVNFGFTPCVPDAAKAAHQFLNTLDKPMKSLITGYGSGSGFEQFLNAYMRAALHYTLHPETDITLAVDGYTPIHFSSDAFQRFSVDSMQFLKAAWLPLQAAIEGSRGSDGRYHYTMDNAAHDFWRTRNHGASGFWDRFLGELGDELTVIAESFGILDIYETEHRIEVVR